MEKGWPRTAPPPASHVGETVQTKWIFHCILTMAQRLSRTSTIMASSYLLPAGAEPILRAWIEAPPLRVNFSTAPTFPSTTQ